MVRHSGETRRSPFAGRYELTTRIKQMDESAHAVEKKDFKFKMFPFDNTLQGDELKVAKKEAEAKAKEVKALLEAEEERRYSDINHTDRCYYIAYSRAGEITSKALELAGEHFKMNASITGGYQVGTSWATTH